MFIQNIKHVDNLIDIRGDASQMDRESIVEQRVSERVKKSLSVGRKYVHNGESFRAVVVDPHLGVLTHDDRIFSIETIQTAATEDTLHGLLCSQHITNCYSDVFNS